jgi:hypothetical protein
VLSRPAQTSPAESEERPFIIQTNVPSTHPRPPWCNTAYALSRRLTQASANGRNTFARRRKAGQCWPLSPARAGAQAKIAQKLLQYQENPKGPGDDQSEGVVPALRPEAEVGTSPRSSWSAAQ